MAETLKRRKLIGGRHLSLLALLSLGVGAATITPAAAAHLGSGVATGTENQLDAADPPVAGTIDVVGSPTVGPFGACGRVKDNDYVDPVTGTDADNLSAVYTLNSPSGTFTIGTTSYTGVTIVIETTSTFYFGPQGTHFGPTLLGNDCGADNLGRLSPVPATTVTVTAGTGTCSASGSFWREGGDEFGVTISSGGTCPGTTEFIGVFQPPCGFPNPVDCITGLYAQH